MARGRFLSTSIAEDVQLNNLSLEAHWLYMMAIPHLDRDGLIKADTYVLFAKACPRRPELIPQIDNLIQEWVDAELVIVYPTPRDGKVAYFKGFAKNQLGMNYSREGASKLPPPPDYLRTNTGVTRNESRPNPDLLTTNSGLGPSEVEGQVQVKEQVKVEVEVKGQEMPNGAAAAANPDIQRIWTIWENNMPGTRTPVIVDAVNDLLNDYSVAEIEEAIVIACKRNRRSFGYVQGILQKGVFRQNNGNHGSQVIVDPLEIEATREWFRKAYPNGVPH